MLALCSQQLCRLNQALLAVLTPLALDAASHRQQAFPQRFSYLSLLDLL
jgi:hypothetical protein